MAFLGNWPIKIAIVTFLMGMGWWSSKECYGRLIVYSGPRTCLCSKPPSPGREHRVMGEGRRGGGVLLHKWYLSINLIVKLIYMCTCTVCARCTCKLRRKFLTRDTNCTCISKFELLIIPYKEIKTQVPFSSPAFSADQHELA